MDTLWTARLDAYGHMARVAASRRRLRAIGGGKSTLTTGGVGVAQLREFGQYGRQLAGAVPPPSRMRAREATIGPAVAGGSSCCRAVASVVELVSRAGRHRSSGTVSACSACSGVAPQAAPTVASRGGPGVAPEVLPEVRTPLGQAPLISAGQTPWASPGQAHDTSTSGSLVEVDDEDQADGAGRRAARRGSRPRLLPDAREDVEGPPRLRPAFANERHFPRLLLRRGRDGERLLDVLDDVRLLPPEAPHRLAEPPRLERALAVGALAVQARRAGADLVHRLPAPFAAQVLGPTLTAGRQGIGHARTLAVTVTASPAWQGMSR
ncbi:hypothetical protein DC74_p00006 (plasmid) [Streptomyces noursei]|nr:hypothetical protein DC74_p00006 [Streptomyces noursei]